MADPKLATERVLSTLNQDGSRFWIHPRLARGVFWKWRAVVAYTLIAVFVTLPMFSMNGKPMVLLNLVAREFTFFGTTFRPTDTLLLLFLGIAVLLSVFWITALWGRIWCGWGCPQSIYLEFVFRPIERWLEGPPSMRRAIDRKGVSPRRIVKWLVYLVLAFALANVFLSYFVGWSSLRVWIANSPSLHPFGFGLVLFVSGLMFFDFAIFREQMCTVACPYGRLQSVLLDKNSLIVGYDSKRGEPRGKPTKKISLPVMADSSPSIAPAKGHCIDCGACVQVCPTGIDIRQGLQMECIGCAQCIDACDDIMVKVAKPVGLIRYSSQMELAGDTKQTWRPRILLYPAAIALTLGLFVHGVVRREESVVWHVRSTDIRYVTLEDGAVASPVQIKIENKSEQAKQYKVELTPDASAQLKNEAAALMSPTTPIDLPAKKSANVPVFVRVPAALFVGGKYKATLVVSEGAAFRKTLQLTLFGPEKTP